MKELFLIEAAKNKALPIGGGLWIPILHPELRIAPLVYGVDFRWQYRPNAGVLRPCAG